MKMAKRHGKKVVKATRLLAARLRYESSKTRLRVGGDEELHAGIMLMALATALGELLEQQGMSKEENSVMIAYFVELVEKRLAEGSPI